MPGRLADALAECEAALRLSPELIAGLSNLAGGLVCQHVGVVPIDKKEFFAEAQKEINV